MSRRVYRSADEYLDLLRYSSISVPEWSLLLSISRSPKPEAKSALNDDDLLDGDPRGMVTREESELALASCLAKGWVCRIDDTQLNTLRGLLRDRGLQDPFYGLPTIGDIDFTAQGAEMFLGVHGEIFGLDWYSSSGYSRESGALTQHQVPSRERAMAVFEELRSAPYCSWVTEPHSTGPWCLYWWLRFPEGYYFTAEYRLSDR
jgi:hypothetical protein